MSHYLKISLIISIFYFLENANAYASKNWTLSNSISSMTGDYSGSDNRDASSSRSIRIDANYRGKHSLSLLYKNATVKFKDTEFGSFDINQTEVATKYQYHSSSEYLAGEITSQILTHEIKYTNNVLLADNVSVIAPKISYINFQKTLSFGFEYAHSKYPNFGDLTIQQITPSLGMGLTDNTDWLQFKLFYIKSNNKVLSQGKNILSSFEMKWSHWLPSGSPFGFNNVFISALTGSRIFAVDSEDFSVYNLSNFQQGSLSFGMDWKIPGNIDITAVAGSDKYKSTFNNEPYTLKYLYISLTKRW